jgi:hypothetical protein
MTTQTDARRVALSSPAGTRSVLRPEAEGSGMPVPSLTASSGGELPRCGAAAAHPTNPATRFYASGVSWPVVENAEGTFLLCGQRVDIVSMPSGLAGEVNNSLKQLWLDTAVLEIEVTSHWRWAFCCQAQPPGLTNMGILELHGVTHHGMNALFQLPASPADRSNCLRWICPPVPNTTVLPLVATVVACAQTALQR